MSGALVAVRIVCLAGIAGCIYMLARNNWVAHNVIELLNGYGAKRFMEEIIHSNDMDDVTKFYNTVFYKFWVWDIEKFIKVDDK